jgi:putative transcriptional regulator
MNTSPQHHPDKNLLIEFAAGTLERAPAIAVKTHLHYCRQCTMEIRQLEEVGAALFLNNDDNEQSTQVSSDAHFSQLMSTIDEMETTNSDANNASPVSQTTKTKYDLPSKYTALPDLVKTMMTSNPLKWQRSTTNLRSASLVADQDQYAVSLQKIRAGGQVPEHEHLGDEITVVLKGSFSDEDNIYQEGDFLAKSVGDKHRPMASSNEDCLCLSVEQAPVRLTGMFTRLFNPFITIARV